MRKIQFRGKSLTSGNWVYGDLVHASGGVRTAIVMNADAFPLFCEVDPKTVGQFTGMYDSAGVPIFEGDVVRDLPTNEWTTENFISYEVAFGSNVGIDGWLLSLHKYHGRMCGGCMKLQISSGIAKNNRIIGSIYDIPKEADDDLPF